jgi:U1 small nuclear ribonucleoprotein 70kDa
MADRKSTPRGQMTRAANSGPAIMMMPPHIRATFMPNPPLQQKIPPSKRRKTKWTGMSQYLPVFESGSPPKRALGATPKQLKAAAIKRREEEHKADLEPLVNAYRQEQRESSGEYEGMNCYNSLFVGRLAYEVTERKLLREFEVFGPVKDLKLIKDRQTNKSRGYAFIEFEHEEDMKRAYRAADGIKLEGRAIVADVERGHTVPNWLPRRLGGGLGGTRLGGKKENVNTPGRFDPSKLDPSRMGGGMGRGMPSQHFNGGGGFGRGGGGPPPSSYSGGFGRGRGGGPGPGPGPPPRGGGQWERQGPPPPRYNDRGPMGGPPGGPGGGIDRHKRPRSRSPERRQSNSRRRY